MGPIGGGGLKVGGQLHHRGRAGISSERLCGSSWTYGVDRTQDLAIKVPGSGLNGRRLHVSSAPGRAQGVEIVDAFDASVGDAFAVG